MSFTQEQGLNIGKNFNNQKIIFPHITPLQETVRCNGCDAKCEIGTYNDGGNLYPTICGKRVYTFKTAVGDEMIYPHLGLPVSEYRSPALARITILQFGQKLTSLCDHYKTR